MTKRAIIVIDIQNEYFPAGKLPLVGIAAAAANARKVIDHGRAHAIPVIHVRHQSPDPQSPIFTIGTPGVEINAAVQPATDEPVVVKSYPNAFRDTELKSLLDELEVEEVVIVGAMSHMCIDATMRAASDLGYKATVVHDACATRDLEFEGTTAPAAQVHATIMAAIAFAVGAVVSTAVITA